MKFTIHTATTTAFRFSSQQQRSLQQPLAELDAAQWNNGRRQQRRNIDATPARTQSGLRCRMFDGVPRRVGDKQTQVRARRCWRLEIRFVASAAINRADGE